MSGRTDCIHKAYPGVQEKKIMKVLTGVFQGITVMSVGIWVLRLGPEGTGLRNVWDSQVKKIECLEKSR